MRCDAMLLQDFCDMVVDIRICTWPRSTAPFLGQSGLMACCASMPRGSSRQNMPVQVPAAQQQLTSFRPSGKLAAVSKMLDNSKPAAARTMFEQESPELGAARHGQCTYNAWYGCAQQEKPVPHFFLPRPREVSQVKGRRSGIPETHRSGQVRSRGPRYLRPYL